MKEAVEHINTTLLQNEVEEPPVQDPTVELQFVLNTFNIWYNTFRRPLTDSKDLSRLAKLSYNLQYILKEIFPEKSGNIDVLDLAF